MGQSPSAQSCAPIAQLEPTVQVAPMVSARAVRQQTSPLWQFEVLRQSIEAPVQPFAVVHVGVAAAPPV